MKKFNFEELYYFSHDMRCTSTKKGKEDVIRNFTNLDGFEYVISKVLNPFLKFNVTSSAVKSRIGNKESKKSLRDLVDVLSDGGRGNERVENIAAICSTLEEHQVEPVMSLIDKELTVGCGAETFNKVFSEGFQIPVFDVQKALDINKYKRKIDYKDWLAQIKYNGVRVEVIMEHGKEVKMLTRYGNEIDSLEHLKNVFQRGVGQRIFHNCVVEGELVIFDEDGEESFSSVMKQLRKKEHQIEKYVFYAFDMIDMDDFKRGSGNPSYETRLGSLVSALGSGFSNVLVAETAQLNSEKDYDSFKQYKVLQPGREGAILRKKAATYSADRSGHTLKDKMIGDTELKVVGVKSSVVSVANAGSASTKEKMVTSVIVDYNGVEVGVSSGLTLEQSREWYKDSSKIIGSIVTIEYFGETKNKKGTTSLYHPRLKTLHGKSRTV